MNKTRILKLFTVLVLLNLLGCKTQPGATLKSIKITKQPANTVYYVGDLSNYTGIEITAYYSDGSSKIVTHKVTYSGFSSLKADNEQTITVTYSENGVTVTTSFTISVIEPKEISIEVTGEAYKKTYYLNDETLDTRGITFIVTYDNGRTENITSGLTVTGFDGTKSGIQTVTVSYHGVSTSYDIEIKICSHEKDKGTITLAPTCVTKGLKTYKCSICKHSVDSEEIPELYSSPIDTETGKPANNHSFYIYFGAFPQTVLPANSQITVDETDAITMGGHIYYKGSDGEYYAKVSAKPYESYNYSDGSKVLNNESRYFKVEPIKWKKAVAGEESNIYLAESILTSNIPYNTWTISRILNHKKILANNYQYSIIRAYLNGKYEEDDDQLPLYEGTGFLQTAFTPEARSWIKTSHVDNSVASTKNNDIYGTKLNTEETYCDDTYDKIFLLSFSEVTGFVFSGRDSFDDYSNERIRNVSDYALANYAVASNRTGSWWLRTPVGGPEKNCFRFVRNDGYLLQGLGYVNYSYVGIIPALSFIWNETERRLELKNENAVKIVETPSFSVAEGIVPDETEVTISCKTEGADIYYTTNGLEPTRFSTPYSTPIQITKATTIKAIAIKTGMVDSDVASSTYVKGIESGVGNLIALPSDIVDVGTGEAGGPFILASYTPVTINGFYMAENELTYAKWYEVYSWATADERGESKYIFANLGKEGHDGNDGAPPTEDNSEPVTNINWRDAVVWCNAASEKEGLTPVYYMSGSEDFTNENVIRIAEDYGSWGTAHNGTHVNASYGRAEKAVINSKANGYRLPTEAEWEYAARGGDSDHNLSWYYSYAGTNEELELENFAVYNSTSSSNVKSKKPNRAGLFDMCGNVMEWCQDLENSYELKNRIVRGGSYKGIPEACTVYHRGITDLRTGYYYIGFRVVRSIIQK